MTPAQRSVVAAAKKDGLSPMEVSAEFICYGIMEALLTQLRKREIAFPKLGEKEQDAAIQEMQSELKKVALDAARMITANGCESVAATLKSLKIDGKLTATMVIDGEEPNRHVLTDKAHDKSGILIVLYPNDFAAGLSEFQGERDQKPLNLEVDDTPAPKKPRTAKKKEEPAAIELPSGLIDQAREFVVGQQNASFAGLQNQLKIGFQKAEALLKHLEGEGVVKFVGDEKAGQYELVRKPAPAAEPESAGEALDLTPTDVHAEDSKGQEAATELTEELYERIKAKVIADQDVGAPAITFDLSDEVASQAIDRLELEGVISEEDDLGGRTVFEQPA